MTTREAIETYFNALKTGGGWERQLAEDMVFTMYTDPMKQVTGRAPYLESTKGLYGMIRRVEVRELLVEGDRACALTQYRLQPRNGDAFTSDVAEVFTVRNEKIQDLSIYFDTAPYPT